MAPPVLGLAFGALCVAAAAAQECEVTSACAPCSSEEMLGAFCAPTGYRERVHCVEDPMGSAPRAYDEFRSCDADGGAAATALGHFLIFVLMLGLLALYGVRVQSRKHMSMYERRRVSS